MAKIGIEVQGKFRGVPTLFLSTEEVIRLLENKNQPTLDTVSQVVVVDKDSKITVSDIEILMGLNERIVITLETPKINLSINDIPSRLNLILVIKNHQVFDLGIDEQVKFECNDGNVVYMVSKVNMTIRTADEFDYYRDIEF